MKLCRAVSLCLLFCVALAGAAQAQGVPRIKARLISFDGKVMVVDGGDAKPMSVGLLPDTRIIRQEKRALGDLKNGDYVGATFTTSKDGLHHAQEVHLFPEALRGSGEGLFPVGDNRFMIDGTVSFAAPGALTLDYRGADGGASSNGSGAACTGRAPLTGGCRGSAGIVVAAGVPVMALLPGDKSLLVPGALLAISLVAGPDGHPMTPGFTVESVPVDGAAAGATGDAAKADGKTPVTPNPAPHRAPSGH